MVRTIIVATLCASPLAALAQSAGFDGVERMRQQKDTDQALSQQQDQAESQHRMADALERIANGGMTNLELQTSRLQAKDAQEDQADEYARLLKTQGPATIREYEAALAKLDGVRFDEWYKIHSIATLAEVMNITRRQKYVDTLTKKMVAIEPEDEFDGRVKVKAKEYFSAHVLSGDELHAGHLTNLLEMRSMLRDGRLPRQMPDRPIRGTEDNTPENREFWIRLQYGYPGVRVFELWNECVDAVRKGSASQSDDAVRLAASKLFHHIAADQILLKAAVATTLPATQ